jgi:hypothetical protein
MYWLFGVVIGAAVLLLLVLTAVNFKRYAWLIAAIFVLLVVLISALYLRDTSDSVDRDAFNEADLVLSNAQLSPSHGSYYQFALSVENLSMNKQLAAIDVLVELLECTDDASPCEVTEASEERINLRLLAGKSKRVEAYVVFSNIAIERADNEWKYTLIRALGR